MSAGQALTTVGRASPRYIAGTVPHRFVEVDAARLLLILARFARDIDDDVRALRCYPARPVARHFSPEYYLHKLDFLLRYPGYFAYELATLHAVGATEAENRDELVALVRRIIVEREPEMLTLPFERFFRGAYERLDDVEGWWHAHQLVYAPQETRGETRPQKHYFVTETGLAQADRLVAEVPHARWYDDRIALIHRFFGGMSAADVKALQYRHAGYRDAQLHETIPDLTSEEIGEAFVAAFGEPLEVALD